MAVPDLRSVVYSTKYAILIDVGYLRRDRGGSDRRP